MEKTIERIYDLTDEQIVELSEEQILLYIDKELAIEKNTIYCFVMGV